MIKPTAIKVGVKIKPCSKNDLIVNYNQNSLSKKSVTLELQANQEVRKFQIDALHDANTSSETTFTDLKINKFIEKFLKGFNVTIMAYGQTGAGKTFCMEGNSNEIGIIQESIKTIFKNKSQNTQVKCSYIQLYNEKIYDLLNEEATIEDNLRLRWESERDFIVEDLKYYYVQSSKQLQMIWKKGTKNRVVASTKIHELSSRSHAIFSISLSDNDENGNFRERQMIFVDLAGSQRIFDKIGKLSRESIEINKSLFVLRKVIKSLEQSIVQHKEVYIPYRQSKLTSILKKALGGNCLTMLIACIDGGKMQKQETISTLSYAISAGNIKNVAKINIDHQVLENRHLKIQNEKLRKELEMATKQIELMHKRQKIEAQKKCMNEYSHKIIQCIGTIRELIKSNKELREELDEERSIKRRQKMEIQKLMQENQLVKKTSHASLYDIPQLPKKLDKDKQYLFPHKAMRISQPKIKDKLKSSTILKRRKYIYHKSQPDEFGSNERSSSTYKFNDQ